MLIVSFSTIPPRFSGLKPTLDSLFAQTRKADRIILYIPYTYRRFPDWDGTLPKVPAGVEIHRVDEDLGPATKVLAAAKEFKGQDCRIVFCDDDRHYDPHWLENFDNVSQQRPDCALCILGVQVESIGETTGERRFQPRTHRTWRITDVGFQLRFLWNQIKAGRNWRDVTEPNRFVFKKAGYVDVAEGCGGVLVRPEFFDDLAYDIPPVLWTVDDVWLSGMMARRDIPIWLCPKRIEPTNTGTQWEAPLVDAVIEGADRATANRMAVEYMQENFKVWL